MSSSLMLFHFIITLLLIGVVLIQSAKADMGIGFGSSSQSVFGSKGAGNFLTRLTSILAVLFIVTSFVLTWQKLRHTEKSVIDTVKVEEEGQKGSEASSKNSGGSSGKERESRSEEKQP